MLYDKARIFVAAGGGGNGCLSFRREANVPLGGPDGGDGGRGGDVVLLCDDSMRDLQSFKRKAHYSAQRGRHGEGDNKYGAEGEDLVVRVPPGTQVTTEDGTLYDLLVPGQRIIAGTRKPPSMTVPLLCAKGVCPPSGQVKTSVPLSVVKMTMVLSSTPMSLSFCMTMPTSSSSCAMPAS